MVLLNQRTVPPMGLSLQLFWVISHISFYFSLFSGKHCTYYGMYVHQLVMLANENPTGLLLPSGMDDTHSRGTILSLYTVVYAVPQFGHCDK